MEQGNSSNQRPQSADDVTLCVGGPFFLDDRGDESSASVQAEGVHINRAEGSWYCMRMVGIAGTSFGLSVSGFVLTLTEDSPYLGIGLIAASGAVACAGSIYANMRG